MKNLFGKNWKKSVVFLALLFGFFWGGIFQVQAGVDYETGAVVSSEPVEYGDGNDTHEKGPGFLGGLAVSAFEGALNLVRQFAAWILAQSGNFLNYMISSEVIDGVFFSSQARAGIVAGWTFVRDFVNLFYIIALVFIAISIILGIDRYSDKKIVFTIVLSALLVNFSMPITLFVVDVSNMAMAFFAEGITGGGDNFTAALTNKMKLGDLVKAYGGAGGTSAFLAVSLAETIFMIVLAVMFFFLAAALLVRMVAFWVLIILSPLAFFGFALPNFKKMTDDWLKKLTNYAFFGPTMLFFLWLSLVVITAISGSITDSVGSVTAPAAGIFSSALAVEGGSMVSQVQKISGMKATTVSLSMVIPFVAAIYMLFYGYDQSKKMASAAGSAVGKVMDKGSSWANKGLKYSSGGAAAAWAGRGAWRVGKKTAAGRYQKTALGRSRFGKLLTKEGRKDSAEAFEASLSGDKDKYERGKVLEQEKKFREEGGKTMDDYRSIMTGEIKGTAIEKKAAAMILAKKGEMTKGADVDAMMRAFGGDKQLKNLASDHVRENIKKSAKDGRLGSASKISSAMEVLRNDRLTGDNKGAIIDVSNSVAKEHYAEMNKYESERLYSAAKKSFDDNDYSVLDEEMEKNAVLIGAIKKEEERLDRKMSITEKRSLIRGTGTYSGKGIVANIGTGQPLYDQDELAKKMYKKKVGGMSLREMTKQKDISFHENSETQARYGDIKNKMKDPGVFRKIVVTDVDEKTAAVLEKNDIFA